MKEAELHRQPNPLPIAAACAEAHHRIANNLQLLNALIQRQAAQVANADRFVTPNEVKWYLNGIASRVSTIASLHRLLSETADNETIDIAVYLGEICEMLRDFAGPDDTIEFTPPCEGHCLLPTKAVLPLALIAVEAVTNALKYAHPTGIPTVVRVSCRHVGGNIALEISEDGVGLPEGFDPATDGGIGMQSMRRMATSVGATLTLDTDTLGLTCRLELPR